MLLYSSIAVAHLLVRKPQQQQHALWMCSTCNMLCQVLYDRLRLNGCDRLVAWHVSATFNLFYTWMKAEVLLVVGDDIVPAGGRI